MDIIVYTNPEASFAYQGWTYSFGAFGGYAPTEEAAEAAAKAAMAGEEGDYSVFPSTKWNSREYFEVSSVSDLKEVEKKFLGKEVRIAFLGKDDIGKDTFSFEDVYPHL